MRRGALALTGTSEKGRRVMAVTAPGHARRAIQLQAEEPAIPLIARYVTARTAPQIL